MVDMKTLTIGGTKFEIVDAEARADISSLQAAVGSPLVASTASAMTDHNKVYVYTGSESGYTSGNWYYWNGTAWTSGGVYNSQGINTDKTLSVEDVAADAKKTGDEIADLKSAISGGIGISVDVKESLLTCFRYVAWINGDGQDYYDALEAALYPPADLVSISAVYTQSGTVFDTASLDDLKADLEVTAHYDDLSTKTITAYTLSGTLTAGTSTITVAYGGKTTTFNVTVTHETSYEYGFYIPSTNTGVFTITEGKDVTHKVTRIDLDCAMPSYSSLSVIMQEGSKWGGVNNGAWDGGYISSADKTYADIKETGRTTIQFSVAGTGESFLGFRGWSNNHPEITIYGIDIYSNDTLQASYKATSTLGEMYDSVHERTISWSDTTGMTLITEEV